MRIGIVAALPGELGPLVRGWTRIESGKHVHCWEKDVVGQDGRLAKWIAVCAGIGCAAATRAFAAAESGGPLSAAVSVGWAGALSAAGLPGAIVAAEWVVNAQTGERFEMALSSASDRAMRTGGLVTTARVADSSEKARLAASYPGAQLVDMEAATVARLASMRGIPAYCFKGVSDAFEDRLPDLNPFIDSLGQFQTVRFVASVALRPRYWPVLRGFGANSKVAAEALGGVVEKFLDEYY